MRKVMEQNFAANFFKKFLIVTLLVTAVIISQAQSRSTNSYSYRTALGVKVWDGAGISLKHFFNGNNAGELIGYFWSRGARFTGLYEIHGDFSGAPGLKWYIGPGAHIGFYNTKYGDGAFAGIDGVIGLDYKFRGAPINMSIDWQPSFEFGDGRGFVGSWGGLGIRYTF
ncbi:MAG TPA: hypothetical protein VFX58_15015 [Chitinophagaceae bacterium]|nr:hypothetical protein [Chitinophagaceae bacterium]